MDQDDVLYDLGCGDGRMLIEVVKASGARGVRPTNDPVQAVPIFSERPTLSRLQLGTLQLHTAIVLCHTLHV